MPDILSLPRGAALTAEFAEGARSFAAGFWFPIGSRHEAPQERGFVHFIEHMAFKGTRRRGAAELSREVDRVGGYLNAFTDRDSICFHCLVPAANWRLALDILADMAFASVFAEEDFLRERDVIVSEILSARDDPEECSHDELLNAVWPGDPLARKIAGEPEDVGRATREGLYGFYRSTLRPDALLATVAGPVTPGEVAGELSRILSSLEIQDGASSGVPSARERIAATPRFQAASRYFPAAIGQVHYYEAIQIDPPFGGDDYYVLAALNGAIGEASSSRLFQSLREREGLCYSIYSGFSMERTECLWIASANVSVRQLPRLAKGLGRELDALASEGLSAAECSDAVSRMAGSFEIALDDPDFRMRRLARQVLFAGQAMDVGETRARIASIDKKALDAMCGRLLAGKERARFVYGKRSSRTAKALGFEEFCEGTKCGEGRNDG